MKHFYLLFILAGIFSNSALAATHTLYSGQNFAIGTVETTYLPGVLLVEANVTVPGWCLVKSHLYVGEQRPEMSAPGRFPYHHDLGCSLSDDYMIDVGPGRHYVAYHAESVETAFAIGGDGSYEIFRGSGSYFEASINGGPSYPAWCIDLSHSINYTTYTDCELRSILDQNLPWVYRPENLAYVQWIINQDWAVLLPGSNWQDIQGSLWKLTQTIPPVGSAGGINWHEAHALTMVQMAVLNVIDFEVVDVQLLVLQCKTGNTLKQTVLIAIDMSPEEFYIREETAWADGDLYWENKKGKRIGWGSYWSEYLEEVEETPL